MLMMNESQRQMMRTHGTLVGRVLLGLLFLVSGWGMLSGMGVSGVAGMIAANGVPLATLCAVIMIAIKILGGAALILGYRTGLAAGLLILFTLIATWFGHVNVADFDQMQQTMMLKNLSIIGGLLYVMAYGPGQGWKVVK